MSTIIESDPTPIIPADPAPPTTGGAGTSFGSPSFSLVSDGTVIRGAAWRFIFTTLESVTLVFLDRLATAKSLQYFLNAPATFTCTVPSDNPEVFINADDDYPFVNEGNRLVYGFRREAGGDPLWVCRYAGIVLGIEDIAGEDTPQTSLTAYDPWQVLYGRPVLKADDFEEGIDWVNANGLNVLQSELSVFGLASLPCRILFNATQAADLEGVSFIDLPAEFGGTAWYTGTVEYIDPSLLFAPESVRDPIWNFQQGSSVGEGWDALVDSGLMDIILTPVYDPINRPGILCELNIYARAGTPRDGAIMAWDEPSRSLVGVDNNIDGTQRANLVRFNAGQGGGSGLGREYDDAASIATYREWVAQRFYPDQTTRWQVNAIAQRALALRAQGVRTFTVSPAPERSPSPLLEYGLGDTVPVYTSFRLREPHISPERVYGLTIDISDNGAETVSELLLSTQGGADEE
jgi:hypothetical protein